MPHSDPPSVVTFEQAVLDGLIRMRKLLEKPESWSGGLGHELAVGVVDSKTRRPLPYAATIEAITNHLLREAG